MSKLLIEEPPLQVLPKLAVKIGLNEAIILQQFHYWLQRSDNIRDGRKWIYNSYPEWNKQFPFWSKNTMIKALKSLEKQGLVITGNYNKAGFDKTKWYTIDYPFLKSLSYKQGVVDDEPETGRRSTRNGYMEEPETGRPIPRDYQENTTEKYNNDDSALENSKSEDNLNEYQQAQLVYENTIGNPSPYILEDMRKWIDDLSSELVIEAIKRADLKGVHNWKYVSVILKNWANNNIKTLEQAKADDVERQNQIKAKYPNSSKKSSRQSEHFKHGDYSEMKKRVEEGKLPWY